jgi:hypothetical protein
MSLLLLGAGGGGVGGSPGATTTWNPADKDAGITLSGGDLTYTGSGGARSTNPLSTGKAYWEVLVNQASSEGSVWNLGFIDGATSFATARGNGFIQCVFLPNGNASNGAATFSSGFSNGDILCIANDFGAKKMWWRKNGGDWNGSALNDPATAVGPNTYVASGPYYAVGLSSNASTSYTANFGATAFTHTMPSGFTSWNGLV